MRAGLILLAAMIGCSAVAVAAHAEDRGRGRDDHHLDHRHFGGARYYGRPPVDYGYGPYYPPPVVYAPGIGINLPELSLNIR